MSVKPVQMLLLVSLLLGSPAGAADLPAVLDWARRVELGTPVSGVITEINVSPGQRVRRGDPLVSLDPRGFRAGVAEAAAALDEVRQHRDEARRESERTLELYDRTLLSTHELQLAEIDAAAADAIYRKAEAALVKARLELEYSRVTAPFDGLVVAVLGEVGEVVASGLNVRPLVVVADDSQPRAKAWVSLSQARGLQPGQAVQVGLGGRWIDARVAFLGFEPVEQKADDPRYDLNVVFDNPPERQWRAGQPVTVRWDE